MQLSLAAHNRLEEMAKAEPAPTVNAAVEERLASDRGLRPADPRRAEGRRGRWRFPWLHPHSRH